MGTHLRRPATATATVAATLSAAVAGLTAVSAPAASAAGNSAAFIGDRGIVVATGSNVNVREPGKGRKVVVDAGARAAYAAGERVVYERNGKVWTRDLEDTVRLKPGAGVDSQKLLGIGQVDGDTIAILAEEREPEDTSGSGYADFFSDLVAYNVNTGERTILREGYRSFESGYTSVHVLKGGGVIAAGYSEAAIFVERISATGVTRWHRRVAYDSDATLAVIGDRVNVIRPGYRAGDYRLRIVRLHASTGIRDSARGVRVPDATSALFCGDWRTPQRLLCRMGSRTVVIDTIGGDKGEIVNRIKAPRNAFVSVIGGR